MTSKSPSERGDLDAANIVGVGMEAHDGCGSSRRPHDFDAAAEERISPRRRRNKYRQSNDFDHSNPPRSSRRCVALTPALRGQCDWRTTSKGVCQPWGWLTDPQSRVSGTAKNPPRGQCHPPIEFGAAKSMAICVHSLSAIWEVSMIQAGEPTVPPALPLFFPHAASAAQVVQANGSDPDGNERRSCRLATCLRRQRRTPEPPTNMPVEHPLLRCPFRPSVGACIFGECPVRRSWP